MKKNCKKNMMFAGGMVNSSTNSLATSLGASDSVGAALGNYGQLGMGAATGDPQDMMQGGAGAMMGGIKSAGNVFNNPYAKGKDKLLAAYGIMNPLAGAMVEGDANKRQDRALGFANDIAGRNQNIGMANGGELNNSYLEKQAYLKKQSKTDPRIIEFDGHYMFLGSQKDSSLYTSPNIKIKDIYLPGDTLTNIPTQQIDSTLIKQPVNNNMLFSPQMNKISETDPNSYKRNKPKLFGGGGELNEFNGGFTHDDQDIENVNEGIPQGITPEGDINTVEKDETRWQDFIFSNKLKVDKTLAQLHNLPKSDIGKTFAELSKKYTKELKDRPSDKFPFNGVHPSVIESLVYPPIA